ncbi:MAG TPA: GatB/YqeY domain-containing protein [Blastocatellia bacterium]
MTLAEKISADITVAMKSRDSARLRALRMIKTALKLRETELPGPIDDTEAVRVLQKLLNQRKDAAEQFRASGRPERAEQEEAEGRLIQSYLPSAPTEQEMREAVEKAIAATGASSPKDMGAVMKLVRADLEGKAVDGKALSDMVKAKLSGQG